MTQTRAEFDMGQSHERRPKIRILSRASLSMNVHYLTNLELQDALVRSGIKPSQLYLMSLIPPQEWNCMFCVEELVKWIQDNKNDDPLPEPDYKNEFPVF